MKKIHLLFAFSCLLFSCSSQKKTTFSSNFPQISEAIQITKNGKEHFYASYYGITSFNKAETYATVLETEIKHALPDETQPATLGLVDMKTFNFIPLTKTSAWNFQEGCMAHWLDDRTIIYNDYRNHKTVSVIMDIKTKREIKVLSFPVSGVAPNGVDALSINFSRLRITRTDYGYAGEGQDKQAEVAFPENDGIFICNLKTGSKKLLISFAQIKNMVPTFTKSSIEYFAHTRFNTDGSKIFWLARGFPEWNTSAFTVNKDGSQLQRSFPDGWNGSHYDWLNEDELMITANYNAEKFAHILFTIGQKNFKKLGKGALDFDAHGTFSPNKKWMVTDAYPNKVTGEQKIFLMNMKTEEVKILGGFIEPKEYSNTGKWRCDIHSRWSPKGNIIGFNSTQNGSRQAYIFRVKE
ncbi:hypothetical protein [Daejeonella sp.]|uniref:hypothetical protein n=1 Tax=Daejeonella sp. TaxID=2805397 RepID=UPI0030C0068A